jgi:hypothetical protein
VNVLRIIGAKVVQKQSEFYYTKIFGSLKSFNESSVTYGSLMRVYCVNKSASRIGRKSGNVIWLSQQPVFA